MARLTPTTAGVLARSMDAVMDARITEIELRIKDVFDPDRCPTSLLPWLAWHRGLTYWSSAWPEAIQRQTIRDASRILGARGTRPGIVAQLGALGAQVEIVEWWEEDPEGTPGTWRALVTPAGTVEADEDQQDEIAAAIERTSALTRPWTIEVGIGATAVTLVLVHARVASLYHATGRAI